jgi:SAM-dependent methyltransferase
MNFYVSEELNTAFLVDVLRKTGIPTSSSVLVVCGGDTDKEALQKAGFNGVTISNLDERLRGDEFAPYSWSFQDAESICFPDGSFDYVMVHAGLHHCASPHRALLEMYRVARKGIVVVEARDSLVMRAAVAMRWVPKYEAGAVQGNDCRYGGVRNSEVPNFIYRWTEREVEKTVASYAPHAAHRIRYFYGVRLPVERFSPWLTTPLRICGRVIGALFPREGNLFGFYIEKPGQEDLYPWMKSPTEFNDQYTGK